MLVHRAGNNTVGDEFAKDFLTLSNMVSADGSDDRVAAIVCAAYIENHIVSIIAVHFPGLTPSLKSAFFDESKGMARSLGNKLDMAFALNAITPGTHADSKLIGRIRNKFAHNLNITSFEDEKVRDLVDRLQTGRNVRIDNGDGTASNYDDGWNRATRFRRASLGICSTLVHQHIKEYPFSYSDESGAFGTGARPPLLDKLSKPPRPDQ